MSPTSYLTAPPRNCIVTIQGGLVNLPLNYLGIRCRDQVGIERGTNAIVEIADDVENSGRMHFCLLASIRNLAPVAQLFAFEPVVFTAFAKERDYRYRHLYG